MIHGSTGDLSLRGAVPDVPPQSGGTRWRLFLVVAAALVLAYLIPLYRLVIHSLNNTIHSHLILIPFISAYFAWQMRGQLATPLPLRSRRGRVLSVFLGLAGVAGLVCFWIGSSALSENDRLTVLIFSFVSFLAAAAVFFLGSRVARQLAFPMLLMEQFDSWIGSNYFRRIVGRAVCNKNDMQLFQGIIKCD